MPVDRQGIAASNTECQTSNTNGEGRRLAKGNTCAYARKST